MTGLPDHYETLAVNSQASSEVIIRAYQKRFVELHASRTADAHEELAEVEEAYAVLVDPVQRAKYDKQFRKVEAKQKSKYAEMDALLKRNRHRPRKRVNGSSGILDAIWALFELFR